MVCIETKIVSAEEKEGLYETEIEIRCEDKVYTVRLCKLIKEPKDIRTRIEGDYLIIDLIGADGRGFGTCQIHLGHVRKGCFECRSLILPPRGE